MRYRGARGRALRRIGTGPRLAGDPLADGIVDDVPHRWRRSRRGGQRRPDLLGLRRPIRAESVLGSASVASSGLTLAPPTGTAFIQPQTLSRLATEVPGGSGNSPRDRYGPAIITVDASAEVLSRVSGVFDGVDLVSRTGACSHLRIVSGSCPTRPNQVLLSTRSAKALGTAIGHTLMPFSTNRSQHRAPPVIVAGLYVAPARLQGSGGGRTISRSALPSGTESSSTAGS